MPTSMPPSEETPQSKKEEAQQQQHTAPPSFPCLHVDPKLNPTYLVGRDLMGSRGVCGRVSVGYVKPEALLRIGGGGDAGAATTTTRTATGGDNTTQQQQQSSSSSHRLNHSQQHSGSAHRSARRKMVAMKQIASAFAGEYYMLALLEGEPFILQQYDILDKKQEQEGDGATIAAENDANSNNLSSPTAAPALGKPPRTVSPPPPATATTAAKASASAAAAALSYCLVTEFCAGGDLGKALEGWAKSNPTAPWLPEALVKRLARQMACGLLSMKKKRIIHRDLKLENVFLSHFDLFRSDVRIGDFGLAKYLATAFEDDVAASSTAAAAVEKDTAEEMEAALNTEDMGEDGDDGDDNDDGDGDDDAFAGTRNAPLSPTAEDGIGDAAERTSPKSTRSLSPSAAADADQSETSTTTAAGAAKRNIHTHRDNARVARKGNMFTMSPERLLGAEYSYPSDVWSLGILLYEMLCGVCPWPIGGTAYPIGGGITPLRYPSSSPTATTTPSATGAHGNQQQQRHQQQGIVVGDHQQQLGPYKKYLMQILCAVPDRCLGPVGERLFQTRCAEGASAFHSASDEKAAGTTTTSSPSDNGANSDPTALLFFPYPLALSLSDEAKDLVLRMLTVDPSRRITVEEMLSHPWLSGTADDGHQPIMGEVTTKCSSSRSVMPHPPSSPPPAMSFRLVSGPYPSAVAYARQLDVPLVAEDEMLLMGRGGGAPALTAKRCSSAALPLPLPTQHVLGSLYDWLQQDLRQYKLSQLMAAIAERRRIVQKMSELRRRLRDHRMASAAKQLKLLQQQQQNNDDDRGGGGNDGKPSGKGSKTASNSASPAASSSSSSAIAAADKPTAEEIALTRCIKATSQEVTELSRSLTGRYLNAMPLVLSNDCPLLLGASSGSSGGGGNAAGSLPPPHPHHHAGSGLPSTRPYFLWSVTRGDASVGDDAKETGHRPISNISSVYGMVATSVNNANAVAMPTRGGGTPGTTAANSSKGPTTLSTTLSAPPPQHYHPIAPAVVGTTLGERFLHGHRLNAMRAPIQRHVGEAYPSPTFDVTCYVKEAPEEEGHTHSPPTSTPSVSTMPTHSAAAGRVVSVTHLSMCPSFVGLSHPIPLLAVPPACSNSSQQQQHGLCHPVVVGNRDVVLASMQRLASFVQKYHARRAQFLSRCTASGALRQIEQHQQRKCTALLVSAACSPHQTMASDETAAAAVDADPFGLVLQLQWAAAGAGLVMIHDVKLLNNTCNTAEGSEDDEQHHNNENNGTNNQPNENKNHQRNVLALNPNVAVDRQLLRYEFVSDHYELGTLEQYLEMVHVARERAFIEAEVRRHAAAHRRHREAVYGERERRQQKAGDEGNASEVAAAAATGTSNSNGSTKRSSSSSSSSGLAAEVADYIATATPQVPLPAVKELLHPTVALPRHPIHPRAAAHASSSSPSATASSVSPTAAATFSAAESLLPGFPPDEVARALTPILLFLRTLAKVIASTKDPFEDDLDGAFGDYSAQFFATRREWETGGGGGGGSAPAHSSSSSPSLLDLSSTKALRGFDVLWAQDVGGQVYDDAFLLKHLASIDPKMIMVRRRRRQQQEHQEGGGEVCVGEPKSPVAKEEEGPLSPTQTTQTAASGGKNSEPAVPLSLDDVELALALHSATDLLRFWADLLQEPYRNGRAADEMLCYAREVLKLPHSVDDDVGGDNVNVEGGGRGGGGGGDSNSSSSPHRHPDSSPEDGGGGGKVSAARPQQRTATLPPRNASSVSSTSALQTPNSQPSPTWGSTTNATVLMAGAVGGGGKTFPATRNNTWTEDEFHNASALMNNSASVSALPTPMKANANNLFTPPRTGGGGGGGAPNNNGGDSSSFYDPVLMGGSSGGTPQQPPPPPTARRRLMAIESVLDLASNGARTPPRSASTNTLAGGDASLTVTTVVGGGGAAVRGGGGGGSHGSSSSSPMGKGHPPSNNATNHNQKPPLGCNNNSCGNSVTQHPSFGAATSPQHSSTTRTHHQQLQQQQLYITAAASSSLSYSPQEAEARRVYALLKLALAPVTSDEYIRRGAAKRLVPEEAPSRAVFVDALMPARSYNNAGNGNGVPQRGLAPSTTAIAASSSASASLLYASGYSAKIVAAAPSVASLGWSVAMAVLFLVNGTKPQRMDFAEREGLLRALLDSCGDSAAGGGEGRGQQRSTAAVNGHSSSERQIGGTTVFKRLLLQRNYASAAAAAAAAASSRVNGEGGGSGPLPLRAVAWLRSTQRVVTDAQLRMRGGGPNPNQRHSGAVVSDDCEGVNGPASLLLRLVLATPTSSASSSSSQQPLLLDRRPTPSEVLAHPFWAFAMASHALEVLQHATAGMSSASSAFSCSAAAFKNINQANSDADAMPTVTGATGHHDAPSLALNSNNSGAHAVSPHYEAQRQPSTLTLSSPPLMPTTASHRDDDVDPLRADERGGLEGAPHAHLLLPPSSAAVPAASSAAATADVEMVCPARSALGTALFLFDLAMEEGKGDEDLLRGKYYEPVGNGNTNTAVGARRGNDRATTSSSKHHHPNSDRDQNLRLSINSQPLNNDSFALREGVALTTSHRSMNLPVADGGGDGGDVNNGSMPSSRPRGASQLTSSDGGGRNSANNNNASFAAGGGGGSFAAKPSKSSAAERPSGGGHHHRSSLDALEDVAEEEAMRRRLANGARRLALVTQSIRWAREASVQCKLRIMTMAARRNSNKNHHHHLPNSGGRGGGGGGGGVESGDSSGIIDCADENDDDSDDADGDGSGGRIALADITDQASRLERSCHAIAATLVNMLRKAGRHYEATATTATTMTRRSQVDDHHHRRRRSSSAAAADALEIMPSDDDGNVDGADNSSSCCNSGDSDSDSTYYHSSSTYDDDSSNASSASAYDSDGVESSDDASSDHAHDEKPRQNHRQHRHFHHRFTRRDSASSDDSDLLLDASSKSSTSFEEVGPVREHHKKNKESVALSSASSAASSSCSPINIGVAAGMRMAAAAASARDRRRKKRRNLRTVPITVTPSQTDGGTEADVNVNREDNNKKKNLRRVSTNASSEGGAFSVVSTPPGSPLTRFPRHGGERVVVEKASKSRKKGSRDNRNQQATPQPTASTSPTPPLSTAGHPTPAAASLLALHNSFNGTTANNNNGTASIASASSSMTGGGGGAGRLTKTLSSTTGGNNNNSGSGAAATLLLIYCPRCNEAIPISDEQQEAFNAVLKQYGSVSKWPFDSKRDRDAVVSSHLQHCTVMATPDEIATQTSRFVPSHTGTHRNTPSATNSPSLTAASNPNSRRPSPQLGPAAPANHGAAMLSPSTVLEDGRVIYEVMSPVTLAPTGFEGLSTTTTTAATGTTRNHHQKYPMTSGDGIDLHAASPSEAEGGDTAAVAGALGHRQSTQEFTAHLAAEVKDTRQQEHEYAQPSHHGGLGDAAASTASPTSAHPSAADVNEDGDNTATTTNATATSPAQTNHTTDPTPETLSTLTTAMGTRQTSLAVYTQCGPIATAGTAIATAGDLVVLSGQPPRNQDEPPLVPSPAVLDENATSNANHQPLRRRRRRNHNKTNSPISLGLARRHHRNNSTTTDGANENPRLAPRWQTILLHRGLACARTAALGEAMRETLAASRLQQQQQQILHSRSVSHGSSAAPCPPHHSSALSSGNGAMRPRTVSGGPTAVPASLTNRPRTLSGGNNSNNTLLFPAAPSQPPAFDLPPASAGSPFGAEFDRKRTFSTDSISGAVFSDDRFGSMGGGGGGGGTATGANGPANGTPPLHPTSNGNMSSSAAQRNSSNPLLLSPNSSRLAAAGGGGGVGAAADVPVTAVLSSHRHRQLSAKDVAELEGFLDLYQRAQRVFTLLQQDALRRHYIREGRRHRLLLATKAKTSAAHHCHADDGVAVDAVGALGGGGGAFSPSSGTIGLPYPLPPSSSAILNNGGQQQSAATATMVSNATPTATSNPSMVTTTTGTGGGGGGDPASAAHSPPSSYYVAATNTSPPPSATMVGGGKALLRHPPKSIAVPSPPSYFSIGGACGGGGGLSLISPPPTGTASSPPAAGAAAVVVEDPSLYDHVFDSDEDVALFLGVSAIVRERIAALSAVLLIEGSPASSPLRGAGGNHSHVTCGSFGDGNNNTSSYRMVQQSQYQKQQQQQQQQQGACYTSSFAAASSFDAQTYSASEVAAAAAAGRASHTRRRSTASGHGALLADDDDRNQYLAAHHHHGSNMSNPSFYR